MLSECFKHPDETFHEDVLEGRLDEEIDATEAELDFELVPRPDVEDVPETAAAFDNEYISLFEAFEQPYAPAIESAYKEWYDGPGSDGLLNGPQAADMRERFETIGISPPASYMPDHLALLLEYASILVENGTEAQHRQFVADHLDWLPAFRRRVENAAAEAPFHRAAVAMTDEAITDVRERIDVAAPTDEEIDAMCDRVDEGTEGVPDEKHFRE
ncbi:MAG: molecular chaperone TorD family protein [Halodesulfurarchaeum sp.]|nr:molecular chaperone TorD family protein [Halodesulfurarchaeum sp.]